MISTPYAAEIYNIVLEILKPIADVSIEDRKASSIVTVVIRKTGTTITRDFVHGLGYSATARNWAKSIFMTHGPSDLSQGS
jgi:hypothetical protein